MWLRIFVAIIIIFLIAPILVVIPVSFTSVSYFEFPPPGYSTKWYQDFYGNEEWVVGLFRSLYVAMLTAILASIIGTMASLAVSRINFWGKRIFMSFMITPMIVPLIIIGVSLYYTFSTFKLVDSLIGLVLAHTLVAIPIIFITVTASLKGVDRNIELAALGLGTTPIKTFFLITVPLIRPGILSGALFAFLISLDEVTVTIFLSGVKSKTLPIVMWENLKLQITPTIAAVSTILIAITVILFLIQLFFSSRTTKTNN